MKRGDQVYSLFIVWYIFLAGMGAGAYTVASSFALAGIFLKRPHIQEYENLLSGGFIFGPVLVMLGSAFLLFDLGSPEGAYRALFDPTPSILSIGVWHIALFSLFSVIVLFARFNPSVKIKQSFMIVIYALTGALAIGLMTYTGLFLACMKSMPFHNTWLLVAIFIVSSLATGSGVVALYGFLNQHRKAIYHSLNFIPRLDLVLWGIELIFLAAFLYTAYAGGEVARYSLELLLFGSNAPIFWGGVVFVGLGLPLFYIVLCLKEPRASTIAMCSACTIVGGFFLRYCIIEAGVHVYNYSIMFG